MINLGTTWNALSQGEYSIRTTFHANSNFILFKYVVKEGNQQVTDFFVHLFSCFRTSNQTKKAIKNVVLVKDSFVGNRDSAFHE